MNWCILIPLLVGIICTILGYLLGRHLTSENHDNCDFVIAKLITELDDCKASLASSLIAFNPNAAKAVFGKTIKENDLTIVEGIGPKIQELFHNNNVNTWKSLSECTVETCQKVLDSGGERFKIHNPGTWPRQAKFAYEGKWQELLDWQDLLLGGK